MGKGKKEMDALRKENGSFLLKKKENRIRKNVKLLRNHKNVDGPKILF